MAMYKPIKGLHATEKSDNVEFHWNGERGQEPRANFGIVNQLPTVLETAVRKPSGAVVVLGRNPTPEYEITSGKRSLSEQQMKPLRDLGTAITPEEIEKKKWNAFRDAPLMISGQKGTNLLRQEAIAATEEQSIDYKYVGGLKGVAIQPDSKVVWQDTARTWQKYAFGVSFNINPVGLHARNRLGMIEQNGGSPAFVPPSHKFFVAREIKTNLGLVYYRKDANQSFSIGARQPDREELYRPYGVSDEV